MVTEDQEQKLDDLFNSFRTKKILVIGDVILDHYIDGNVARISPEAPVPVVRVTRDRTGLGGAANVAHNIKSLGGVPMLVGVVGNDGSADTFFNIAGRAGIDCRGIVKMKNRPTTLKTRVIAQGQQVVRIDREEHKPVSPDVEAEVIQRLDELAGECNGIILEDYNKGLLSSKIIKRAIETGRELKVPVTVDPKFQNFSDYRGATLLKPNQGEVEKILGIEIANDKELDAAFEKIEEKLDSEYLLITRSHRGMVLKKKGAPYRSIGTVAREVYDVSGAGDTVIAMVTLGIASGCDPYLATCLANIAAGIGVERRGVVAITVEDVRERLLSGDISSDVPL